jgi:hypothetical protein
MAIAQELSMSTMHQTQFKKKNRWFQILEIGIFILFVLKFLGILQQEPGS